jgi:F0F1-type ATP synthase membrane subunit b/b'
MSGVESVQIIVAAEREAAKMLEDAQTRATEIRKTLDSSVQEQREGTIRIARKEASTLIQNAEQEARAEAKNYEKDAADVISQAITRASSKKNAAVERLVTIIMELG